MNRWLVVAVLAVLVLTSAMGLKALTTPQTLANTSAPMPITPWMAANTSAPMPITPWLVANTSAPMPITPW
jgi:hypothetical protein